jgi:quercetin dioxygenase-like cupin family protein
MDRVHENKKTLFPKGDQAPPDYFTGTAWLKMLVNYDDLFHCSIGHVTFERGARNNWHTHPGGQILIITEGTGYYQEKDKSIQLIEKGDVIRILPDVIHWHGATPDSQMTHLAINPNAQNGVVNWLQPVSAEEYENFEASKL